MSRWGLLLACLLSLTPSSSFGTPSAKGEAVFEAVKGWEIAAPEQRFGPGELWEHINGGAETFLHYGFQELREAVLASGDVRLTVGVYDMGSPLSAFGIYRVEADDESADLGLGAASQGAPPYQWLLLKDRFYVKVEYTEGEASAEQGLQLLGEIARHLPGDDSLPEELGWLPEKGRVTGTEEFTLADHLGLSELDRCVHADYLVGKNRQALFLLLPAPGASVDAIWKTLAAQWKRKRLDGRSTLVREIPYKGVIGVVKTKQGLVGVCCAEDEAELKRNLSRLVPDKSSRR